MGPVGFSGVRPCLQRHVSLEVSDFSREQIELFAVSNLMSVHLETWFADATRSVRTLLVTSASLLVTSALLVVTRTLRTGLLAVLLGAIGRYEWGSWPY